MSIEEMWEEIEKLRAERDELRRIVGLHQPQLCDEIRLERDKLLAEVERLRELHTMQLAGIMTASMQNTDSTVKDRIDRSNPYWTQAYEDVCAAVDREMKLRAEVERLREAGNGLMEIVEGVRSRRWAVEGLRFKDTNEWVRFYLAQKEDTK